jgi:hypothetical protein
MSVTEQRWPLRVRDAAGRERSGCLLLAPRWREELGRPEPEEEFRIVVLAAPAQEVHPQGPVVVCLPAAPVERGLVAEAAATYATATGPVLPAPVLERLRRGRLACPLPLGLSPSQVFTAKGARWPLLARRLLARLAQGELLAAAAQALWAPGEPPASPDQPWARLQETVARARAALPAAPPPELAMALARLEGWLQGQGARPPYQAPLELARDVWAARALAERPQEALEVAAMRRFLAEAASPQAELELDRALAQEQLSYAALVLEPQRLAAARAAFTAFLARYRQSYQSFHRSYWQEARQGRERLLAAAPRVRALRLLATLAELGPAPGQKALDRWEGLLRRLVPCPEEAPALAAGEARCPRCRLELGAPAPTPEVEECLRLLERALGRQMARLARALVADALRDRPEAGLEGLLRALQASQVAPLAEVLDEAMVGQVRRVLAEAGVRRALGPVLDALQQGRAPGQGEVAQALARVRQVLERSARPLGTPPP